MIVQLTGLDPIWSLFTVIGILTLFGKKKKDDRGGETTPEESPTPSTSAPDSQSPPYASQNIPIPAGASAPQTPQSVGITDSYQISKGRSSLPQGDEDTSLSSLLQSLLKDLPQDASSIPGEPPGGFSMENVPEWVPPRATPSSRPMVISPGGKQPSTPDKPTTPASIPVNAAPPPPAPQSRSPKAPDRVEPSPKETVQPKFYPSPSIDKPEEAPKPSVQPKLYPPQPSIDKPEKIVKEEGPKRPSPPKVSQSFDHIFEITQGSFDSPGLVVVNGSQGSGKTTICSALVSSLLKQGSPCMFVTYDEAPGTLREQMKKLGVDPSQAESNFRLLIVDGFSSQSDLFSFEPYYVEKAFDFDSIQEALVKNSSMFFGEKTKILFDSMDQVVAKVASKDVVKRLGEALDKLKESNATIVVTLDLSKAPKDVVKWLEDTASCVIDIGKDDSDPNGRELKVRKLNGSISKVDTETFEIDAGKGLVFVN